MNETAPELKYDDRQIFVDSPNHKDLPPIGCESGLKRQSLKMLAPQLRAARQDVLADLNLLNRPEEIPPEKDPLDAAFIELPADLLDDPRDELARIKMAADRLAEEVDRVVVLGIGGSYMGARAMFESLCHPYHNEQAREKRKNRPRLYFEGNNVDNDAVRGLLELLADGDPWGIIVISKSGGTLETGAAFRVFLGELRKSCKGDEDEFKQRIIAVSSEGSDLWNLVKSIDVPEDNLFDFPDHVGGRFSVLSAVGLLPAAVLGLDIERLLEGALAMTERFRDPASRDSIVQDFVGVCHLMEMHRGLTIRVLSTWGKRLESFGLWYDQLLAESLGKDGRGATPLVVVNTRDLHSRGQQHQEGRRDRLFTNLIVDEANKAPVKVPFLPKNEDNLNELVAEKELPDILRAAYEATNDAYGDDFRRTATIHLPRLDEYCLGQLFQMLMLATVLEGRLIGINPYGQPGVKKYKEKMEQNLRELGTRPH